MTGVPPYLLRNYSRQRKGKVQPTPLGPKWLVRDAILASTATLHFSPCSVPHRNSIYKYEDASSAGWSNPAKLAWDEADAVFPGKRMNVLLSMGIGLPNLIKPENASRGENWLNERIQQLEQVAHDTERDHRDLMKALYVFTQRSPG